MNPEEMIHCGDALEWLRSLPEACATLALTDPPYNIGIAKWDKIPDYVPWICSGFKECARVTTKSGQLIFWHNDMPQLVEIMHELPRVSPWRLNSFITCYKPGWRALGWKNPKEDYNLRSWFNVCEYCTVWTRVDAPGLSETGLTQCYSLPQFSAPLREYMLGELARAGLANDANLVSLFRKWGKGGTGAMLRHYFSASQFELPTRAIYEGFFQTFLREATGIPDLFPRAFEEQRQAFEEQRQAFEEQRQAFEEQRQAFEEQRPVHNLDPNHCNLWEWTGMNDGALHPCRKPIPLLARLIRTHSRVGDLVLDPFAGSGSTGEAAIMEHRRFLGCELDARYAETARRNIRQVTPMLPAFVS